MTGVPTVWTIVVAAGSSQRFGSDKLSAVLEPPSVTVLDRSIAQARKVSTGVVVVRPEGSQRWTDLPPGLVEVAGGSSRSASVRAGLDAVPDDADIVLVHDAARPLADGALYQRVIAAVASGADVAIPVVRVVDTIREVGGGVVDRERLRAVQTPQGFVASTLRRAHAGAQEATDDAALVEAIGAQVVLVDGDDTNLKITTPTDLEVARALVAAG